MKCSAHNPHPEDLVEANRLVDNYLMFQYAAIGLFILLIIIGFISKSDTVLITAIAVMAIATIYVYKTEARLTKQADELRKPLSIKVWNHTFVLDHKAYTCAFEYSNPNTSEFSNRLQVRGETAIRDNPNLSRDDLRKVMYESLAGTADSSDVRIFDLHILNIENVVPKLRQDRDAGEIIG